jgi:hypothetical protein
VWPKYWVEQLDGTGGADALARDWNHLPREAAAGLGGVSRQKINCRISHNSQITEITLSAQARTEGCNTPAVEDSL